MDNQPRFDGYWKRRALGGDAEALDQLIDVSVQPLFRFCLYRLRRNRQLCEDVVQETLVRAIAELSSYQPHRSGDSVLPWLTGLARNEIRRALSREPATCSLDSHDGRMDEALCHALSRLESAPLENAVLQRDETREMVCLTMSELPRHYREVLEAKYILRCSVCEIAAERATSEKAIESLLSRARRAFREAFLARARNLHSEMS